MIKKVATNMEEVRDFFKNFNVDKFSIDCETVSSIHNGALRYDTLQISGISFCNGKKAVYCVIDSLKNTSSKQYIESDILFNYLKTNVFKDNCAGKTVVMHNAPFDGMVLGKYGVYFWDAKYIFDTMVASHLIDENRPSKGLKQLCRTELDIEPTTFDEVKASHYTQEFFQYGMDDAINTWKLAVHFAKQLKEMGLMKLMTEVESDFQKVLIQMKLTGVLIDRNFLETTTKELRQAEQRFEKELYDLLGEKYSLQVDLDGGQKVVGHYNFKSSQQLGKILFGKLGLEVVEKTETGQPKTGKITLERHSDNSFVKKLNQYKICVKLLNGFFEPMPTFIQSDERIRPNFLCVGTTTGRLSSTKPNFQNQPKRNKEFPIETRKCFVTPKEYLMVGCDFSGQESRIIAHLSDDYKLKKLFEGDGDFHLSTANGVFNLGIPLEALNSNHPDNEKYKTQFKDERNRAKTINFAVPYGTKAYGLAQGMKCSEEDAQIFLDNFFKSHPGVKQAMESACAEVKQFGFVRTELGRYRRFSKNDKGYYDAKCYRQSFNHLIQGFASDMMRKAMNSVFNEAKKHPEWDLKAILSIHDEGIYLVKEEYAEEASKMIKHCFESCVELKVPVVADVAIGKTYAEVK